MLEEGKKKKNLRRSQRSGSINPEAYESSSRRVDNS